MFLQLLIQAIHGILIRLTSQCWPSSKSINNGFAKSQNKLKYNSQAQKMAPNGWASREAKWVFATIVSHLCPTLFICHFIFLIFCFLKPHSLSLSSFFVSSVLLCGCQSHGNQLFSTINQKRGSRCRSISLALPPNQPQNKTHTHTKKKQTNKKTKTQTKEYNHKNKKIKKQKNT